MLKRALLIPLIFVACIRADYKKQDVQVIEFYSSIQSIQTDNGKKIDFKDSVIICNTNNYIIYKKPFLHSFYREGAKQSDTVNLSLAHSLVKFKYIIFNKNKKYGYLYDSVNAVKPKRVSVDSVEREVCMIGFPFFTSNDVLASKKKIGSLLIETRVPKQKLDDSYPDSGYYFYDNKFKDAPYSFSSLADSLNKKKLFKIRYIYNPVKKGRYPIDVPKREYHFELRKVNVPTELAGFIERFKSEEAKLDASLK